MADRGQHTKIVDSLRSHICESSTLTFQVSAVPTSIYVAEEEERCELLGNKSDNHSGARFDLCPCVYHIHQHF